MKKIRKALKKGRVFHWNKLGGGKIKIGYKEIKCYIIFDINMDGKFT